MAERRIIDFTKSRWGHAMHGSTWTDVREPNPFRRLWFRLTCYGRRRSSVMVHCQNISVGDVIEYQANSGVRRAGIYRIKPCGNPHDMHEIYVEAIEPARGSGKAFVARPPRQI